MKLSPMDIKNKEFKKGIRGYSAEEVDEFILQIAESYEETYKENSILKESLERIQEKLEHYEQLEATIQNTLLLAQNAADQAKENSEKEANFLVTNANERAQKILDKAHSDVVLINDEYEKVKGEFIKFRAKFRGFMNTQLETFDELEKDLTKNYNVSEPIEESNIDFKEADTTDKSGIEIVDNEVLEDDLSGIKSFYATN